MKLTSPSSSLEISKEGRPVVWLADWSTNSGVAFGRCLFTTKEEALKYAVAQALPFMNWQNFPDPSKKYPYDDRDGSKQELTPIFRASWLGGWSQVTRTEVEHKFTAADYLMREVNWIFDALKGALEAA